MIHATKRFFVITGGPGSGKTTLINALKRAGYGVTEEAGRRIIKEQAETSGDALPWANRERFAAAMLERDIESYKTALAHSGITIFDRGIPDVIGYLNLEGLPVPDRLAGAAQDFRYNRRVFIAPPWPEIFAQDSERRQTLEVAEQTYRAMVKVYGAFDYELTELPRAAIEDRVRFVQDFAKI